MATNPLLAELNNLSPAAKAALVQAHAKTAALPTQTAPTPLLTPPNAQIQAAPIGMSSQAASNPKLAAQASSPGLITPPDSQPMVAPISATQGGKSKTALLQAHQQSAPQPQTTPPSAQSMIPSVQAPPPMQLPALQSSKPAPRITPPDAQPEVPPIVATPQEEELQRQIDSGSGISQIHSKIENSGFGKSHPLLGKTLGWAAQIPAMIGDIGASAVAPAITANVPGTEYHHERLIKQGENQVAQQAGNLQKEAQAQEEQAQGQEAQARIPLETAQGQLAQAQADLIKQGKGWKVEFSPGGEPLQVTNGVQSYLSGEVGIPAEAQQVLDTATQNYQTKQTQDLQRQQKPLSKQQADALNATWNQIAKQNHLPLNQFQEGMPSADAAMIASSFNNVIGRGQGQQHIGIDLAGLTNQENKQSAADRKQIYTAYQPAMDSAERFNVMTKNYEDAVKNHDQQAMLSLLANHLGMTMGLQKGSRITRDLYKEAQNSLPWLQGVKAKFDDQGYLSGVTLSPQQMRSMVNLAQDRYREDVTKARNEANYLGSTDDGPKRTPSKATINFYLAQTGGDVNKAKQMAAADGWSVE